MGVVNPKREVMTEINFHREWDLNPKPLDQQVGALPQDNHSALLIV